MIQAVELVERTSPVETVEEVAEAGAMAGLA
jgi:hypothetical protein